MRETDYFSSLNTEEVLLKGDPVWTLCRIKISCLTRKPCIISGERTRISPLTGLMYVRPGDNVVLY